MKRYCKDRSLWELFAFAVCIKMAEGSSAIHADVKTVRRMLNCSYYKAVRLVERAKECPALFRYYREANLLVARSFTRGRLDRTVYRAGRKEFTAYHACCYKHTYEPTDRISHMELSKHLRDILIKMAIEARQLKHDLTTVVNKKKSTRANRSNALYAVKLGHISGYHHSTVSRHIRKMEEAGEVITTRPDAVAVLDLKSGEVLTDRTELLGRRGFVRHGVKLVRDANTYSLSSCERRICTHVIFNHAKRHHRNARSSAQSKFSDRWLEFINR